MHHRHGLERVQNFILKLLISGSVKRILREFNTELEAEFAKDSIEKVRAHPVAILVNAFKARITHELLELPHRKLLFPTRKPLVHRNQNMLDNRIGMNSLRHVAKAATAMLYDAEIFLNQRERILEMFSQALMENQVKSVVRERRLERIATDQVQICKVFAFAERINDFLLGR